MSSTSILSPTDFQERLEKYLFERSEEWRAVRVGEKETSEQAEIVRRYADLFSREQLDALREAEDGLSGDDRELLYRLRKTCESGLVSAQLAEREDELENRFLAERITFKGEEMPLRNAQALLAVLLVQGRGDAAPERSGTARGAPGVPRARRARPHPGGRERGVQPRPARADARRRGARRGLLRHRRPDRAERGGEGDLAARAVARPPCGKC